MHFSLVYAITAAILAVVPLVSAQGVLPNGVYRLENMFFDTSTPKRVFDLKDHNPLPGTPIIAWPENGGDNQHWNITTSGAGYNVRAVAPANNAFVASIGIGAGVTATPNDTTTFLFNKLGANNIYQVLVATSSGAFAVQSTTDLAQCTLGRLDATDPHQTWRLVAL